MWIRLWNQNPIIKHDQNRHNLWFSVLNANLGDQKQNKNKTKNRETHQNNSQNISCISPTAYLHSYFIIHDRNYQKSCQCKRPKAMGLHSFQLQTSGHIFRNLWFRVGGWRRRWERRKWHLRQWRWGRELQRNGQFIFCFPPKAFATQDNGIPWWMAGMYLCCQANQDPKGSPD